MSRLRWWAKALTPPIVLLGLRKLFPKKEPVPEPAAAEPAEWEHVPEGWGRPVPGWNAEGVLTSYERKWPAFLRALVGSGPLGVNHEAPVEEIEPADDVSAHNRIGHYYALAKAVLRGVEIEYASRDLPLLSGRGRELFPDAAFHDDDSCLARRYDLVLASSSLHYSEDWRGTLAGLARATAGYLYLTRVPLARRAPSFVVLQRAQRHGYGTEYLGWVLNRDELLGAAREAGLELVREFLLDAQFAAEGAPESPTPHGGFLFRPYTDAA